MQPPTLIFCWLSCESPWVLGWDNMVNGRKVLCYKRDIGKLLRFYLNETVVIVKDWEKHQHCSHALQRIRTTGGQRLIDEDCSSPASSSLQSSNPRLPVPHLVWNTTLRVSSGYAEPSHQEPPVRPEKPPPDPLGGNIIFGPGPVWEGGPAATLCWTIPARCRVKVTLHHTYITLPHWHRTLPDFGPGSS